MSRDLEEAKKRGRRRRIASTKALSQGSAWCVSGAARRPVWLEWREGKEKWREVGQRDEGPGHPGPHRSLLWLWLWF